MSEKKEEMKIQPSVEKLRVAYSDNSGVAQTPASMLGGAGNLEKIKEILEMNKAGKSPEKLEDFARKPEKKELNDLVVGTDDLHRFDKK